MSNEKIEIWFELIDREFIKLYEAAINKTDYELFDFTQYINWIIEEVKSQGLKDRYADKVDEYIEYLNAIFVNDYCGVRLVSSEFNDERREYTLKHTLYYADNTSSEDKVNVHSYDDNIFMTDPTFKVNIDDIKKLYDDELNNRHQGNTYQSSTTWFQNKISSDNIYYKGVHYRETEKKYHNVFVKKRVASIKLYRDEPMHIGIIDAIRFIKSLIEKYASIDIKPGALNEERRIVEAKFANIQSEIIKCIEEARVSILVAMAWFTDDLIKDAIIKKQEQGLRIEIVTFKDGVNKLHGVDLLEIDHSKIRGTRGGIMHDKFCIIDNQLVISGSYNWSDGAAKRNDENITILRDNNAASDFSVEFRRLKPLI